MFRRRVSSACFLAFFVLCCSIFFAVPAAVGQIAEPREKPEDHQHMHGMDMNIPSGVTDKCQPQFTYSDGPLGPSHWPGVCTTGLAQSPVDITKTKKMSIPPLAPLLMSYQPVDLDMVNDCNHYRIKARFPKNQWLKVNRKPYRLSEIRFLEPGENAVNGKRPAMSLQFVHLSPELSFLVIEVPVVVGKENPVIKTLWEHIPAPGKEVQAGDVKINPADLLPADHAFYFYRGSLTAPACNEGAMWYVMKNPIEMSAAQIKEYENYYHNTARPLQSLGERPLVESTVLEKKAENKVETK